MIHAGVLFGGYWLMIVNFKGAKNMRARASRLGMVEWAFIGAILVLIVAEWAAFRAGLGSYVAVISIGYLLALVTGYLLYRHDKVAARVRTENAAALEGVDIFKGLTPQDIDAVASLGERVQVSSREILGKAGGPGDHLYIIIQGNVQLSAESPVGEITVRIAGPGESFPLATLIDPGTLITSATVMTDGELLAIPRSELLALCKENPEIGVRMYAAMAGILAGRYRSTLAHLSGRAEQVLRGAGFWANV
jgi:CRP-like cAMP-binding protein